MPNPNVKTKPESKAGLVLLATVPRGDYKFITTTSGGFQVENNEDVIIASYFTETGQFMVTDLLHAVVNNIGFEINEQTKSIDIVRLAVKCDLSQRVQYLYKLLDDVGFRIYALFVLGVVVDGVFKAFDIYAGVAGQGVFLPLDQVRFFLESINIAEVVRT